MYPRLLLVFTDAGLSDLLFWVRKGLLMGTKDAVALLFIAVGLGILVHLELVAKRETS